MFGIVRLIAHKVRQVPGIRRATPLWRALRVPYYYLLSLNRKGIAVLVGGSDSVRMPVEFCGGHWETYEQEAVKAVVNWLRVNPRAILLDVGSEVGFYSLLALFASNNGEVLAFDPDPNNLKATQRMCQYASGNRLRLVHGFLSNQHRSGLSLNRAIEKTKGFIAEDTWKDEPDRNTYICIHNYEGDLIPTHSLDGLLPEGGFQNRSILLKCDVEGAELLVLKGAEQLLSRCSPTLLISVHPRELENYGQKVPDVTRYLENAGYRITVLSVDHEEHWWCEKASNRSEHRKGTRRQHL